MKKLFVIPFLVFVPLALQASQRVVVTEDFTATWCPYCPGGVRGVDELKFRAFDSVVVVGYHASTSDPFYTSTASQRKSYYGVSGYPTAVLDGSHSVVGGMHIGTMYPVYRQYYDYRVLVESPLEIGLSVTYDTTSRQGQLTINLKNTSTSVVSGQLQVALCESHIYYPWQGLDSLHDVERTMLPNASGEAVTVPAGDSLMKTRDFTIAAGWVAKHCNFIVFVQNNSSKEVFQGACAAVIPEPALEFVGYQTAFPMPGSTTDLTVGLRNIGSENAAGASAVLSTSDPHITVTSANASFNAIAVGRDGYATSPFTIEVADSCPDPHLATMNLEITLADGDYENVNFPLNVTTNTGFADSMEQGVNGWTHGGTCDNWHQTEHQSNSPSHSWYCGLEGSWQYTNENDARLITPYFTVGTATAMNFQHYYRTEDACDFCMVAINNGSPFWWQLASYTGNSSGWQQEDFDLADFSGQTVRLRFRFISDYNTTNEGWYIDDFWCSPTVGIEEGSVAIRRSIAATCNPVRTVAEVSYQIPVGKTGDIAVYDAGGRLVQYLGRNLEGKGRVKWNLTDANGNAVRTGTYFARLVTDHSGTVTKIVITR